MEGRITFTNGPIICVFTRPSIFTKVTMTAASIYKEKSIVYKILIKLVIFIITAFYIYTANTPSILPRLKPLVLVRNFLATMQLFVFNTNFMLQNLLKEI